MYMKLFLDFMYIVFGAQLIAKRGKSKEYIHKYMLATRTLLRELTMELQS